MDVNFVTLTNNPPLSLAPASALAFSQGHCHSNNKHQTFKRLTDPLQNIKDYQVIVGLSMPHALPRCYLPVTR